LKVYKKIMEEKAETPEELDMLREKTQNWFNSSGDALTRLGEFVAGEGALEFFVEKIGKPELLKALLSSNQDEGLLQDQLGNLWWKLYGDLVQEGFLEDLRQANNSSDVKNLQKKKPRFFEGDYAGLNKIMELGKGGLAPKFFTLESWRKALYRLGPITKYGILRKLLPGEEGILANEKDRLDLLKNFFDVYLHEDIEPELFKLLQEVFTTLFQTAPADELYLILDPLLRPRIANPPETLNSWDAFLADLVKEANLKENRDAHYLVQDKGVELSSITVAFRNQIHYAMTGNPYGEPPKPSPAEKLMEILPEDFIYHEAERLSPIELTLDSGRHFGAPGPRLLQLLGHTVNIPEEHRPKFFNIFDDVKVQGKISFWETIKRELPEYASQVKRIGKRLGGGSLMTVYEVELHDGTFEAVRVLNPNAKYHADTYLKIMRETVESLSESDPKYEIAKPLLDLLEQWINRELGDPTFETDDVLFRDKWNGWKPDEEFPSEVVVPLSIPTGTHKVRRERIVLGENFKYLHTFPKEVQKKMVALAVTHYVEQIKAGQVHSDISPGNLRITPEENLAILDRGMYLKFEWMEKLFLNKLRTAKDLEAQTRIYVDWIWGLPENQKKAAKLDKEAVIKKIVEDVGKKKIPIEESVIDSLTAIHGQGLRTPLKYTLLFKNLNVLLNMSKDVGFTDLEDAVAYTTAASLGAIPPEDLVRHISGKEVRAKNGITYRFFADIDPRDERRIRVWLERGPNFQERSQENIRSAIISRGRHVKFDGMFLYNVVFDPEEGEVDLAQKGIGYRLMELIGEMLPEGVTADTSVTNTETRLDIPEMVSLRDDKVVTQDGLVVVEGKVMEGEISLNDILAETVVGKIYSKAGFGEFSMRFEGLSGVEALRDLLVNHLFIDENPSKLWGGRTKQISARFYLITEKITPALGASMGPKELVSYEASEQIGKTLEKNLKFKIAILMTLDGLAKMGKGMRGRMISDIQRGQAELFLTGFEETGLSLEDIDKDLAKLAGKKDGGVTHQPIYTKDEAYQRYLKDKPYPVYDLSEKPGRKVDYEDPTKVSFFIYEGLKDEGIVTAMILHALHDGKVRGVSQDEEGYWFLDLTETLASLIREYQAGFAFARAA